MGARSQDSQPRGTLVRDREGDVWRKGTAWWHWTARSADTGVGKLLWTQLESDYGPLRHTGCGLPVERDDKHECPPGFHV
jgi:hypothetical protein